MAIGQNFRKVGTLIVEELQKASSTPEARSVDRFPALGKRRSTVTRKGDDADKHYPDKRKIQEYWDLYKHIPILRKPIRSFASEVVSPGYYVDAEDEDLKEDLEDWLSKCAIVDGEIDRDFRLILKKSIIQREVKGTALIEKVRADDDSLYGFKMLRPETVRAFTLPGQTVLLPPDFEFDEENSNSLLNRLNSERTIYFNDDGEAAAYVQLDDAITSQSDGFYIAFTRDEIIKLTRDADVGEIFGTSRFASIENRLHALLKKLEDNDKAIESISQPFQLFLFGDEENPWEPKEIENFMSEHSQSDFEPGMKQGVQGDIDVETISGDTPDIEAALDFDLNYILSELPMPKYSLGGFESDVNQFVSRSQSARLERSIEDARHEVEMEMNSVLEEKAEEMGYNSEDFNSLVISEDPDKIDPFSEDEDALVPEDDVDEGNIPEGNNSDEDNEGPAGENFERPGASTEPDREGGGETV